MPLLIALCGPIGSGKSTIAEHLSAKHSLARVRFAGPLKDMLKALGLSKAQLDGDQKEVPSPLLCGRTPRWAMQTLGTEWGRALIHQDLWTTIWQHRVRDCFRKGQGVVVDDLRFPNEEALIRTLGGQIWQVHRDAPEYSLGYKHPSEAYVPSADHQISNSGSIQDLCEMVDGLLTQGVSNGNQGS